MRPRQMQHWLSFFKEINDLVQGELMAWTFDRVHFQPNSTWMFVICTTVPWDQPSIKRSSQCLKEPLVFGAAVYLSGSGLTYYKELQPRVRRTTSRLLNYLFSSYFPGDTRVSNWHYAGVDVQMTIQLIEKYFSLSRREPRQGNIDWYYNQLVRQPRLLKES